MKTHLPVISRWFIGLLLVWAALSKLPDPQQFVTVISAYRLGLPLPVVQLVALALPWLELLCGILLIMGQWVAAAAGLVVGMFAVFLMATTQAWVLGLEISCGCFNSAILQRVLGERLVHFIESVQFATFRNLFLLLCAGYVWKTAPAGAVPARQRAVKAQAQ